MATNLLKTHLKRIRARAGASLAGVRADGAAPTAPPRVKKTSRRGGKKATRREYARGARRKQPRYNLRKQAERVDKLLAEKDRDFLEHNLTVLRCARSNEREAKIVDKLVAQELKRQAARASRKRKRDDDGDDDDEGGGV